MRRNQGRDIALIAKELGLEEDLIKPTGEGLRGEIIKIKNDLNGIGKKVNQISDIQKKFDLLEEKLSLLEKKNFSLPPPLTEEKEEEKEKKLNQYTIDVLLGYAKSGWKIFKPLIYGIGFLLLYILTAKTGINLIYLFL